MAEDLADRVVLLPRVQQVLHRRVLRLVVRGQRAVDQPGRGEQPGLAVGLHDEGVGAGDRGHAGGAVGRAVGRRTAGDEVGDVVPGPLAGLGVPPHQCLALAPGLAVGVGGGPVVQHPPVRRPGPAPLVRHPVLLAARLAAGGLVDPVGVDPAVDPAAGRRRAVVLQLGVGGHRLAVAVPAVDFGQHRLGVGLLQRALRRVVPGEVEHGAVHLRRLPPAPASPLGGQPSPG